MAKLYLVGTPIGNLEDMTHRAVRVLGEVALIAAEDTRVTRKLLSHFNLSTPMISYSDAYERGKEAGVTRVLQSLAQEQSVALVSDAGMPGLADPGYELLQAVVEAGHEITVVPGPSAITAALVASGLPSDRFLYVGFLPRKRGERQALLADLAEEPGTIVAYEAPHRLQATLADLVTVMGDRPVAVARELTKRYEEVWRGQASGALAHFTAKTPRGEITLVIGGAGRQRQGRSWDRSQMERAVGFMQEEGLSAAAIARVLGRISDWSRSQVYELAIGQRQVFVEESSEKAD